MERGQGTDSNAMEYSLRYNPPVDAETAAHRLVEVKDIFDQLGITFVLSSGSCLGAVRDSALIPWDDDIDLVSIIGENGLTPEVICAAIEVFRTQGFYVRRNPNWSALSHSFMKDYVRIDWSCLYQFDGKVYSYPGVAVPSKFYVYPRYIEFLGLQFLVPDPPEDYLELKYGPEWMIPKRPGQYEQDVIANVETLQVTGDTCVIRIMAADGSPVGNARVTLAGGSDAITNEAGEAQIMLGGTSWYALTIRYPGHEQALYMEELEPDTTYVYRADSVSRQELGAAGDIGTLGNVLIRE